MHYDFTNQQQFMPDVLPSLANKVAKLNAWVCFSTYI